MIAFLSGIASKLSAIHEQKFSGLFQGPKVIIKKNYAKLKLLIWAWNLWDIVGLDDVPYKWAIFHSNTCKFLSFFLPFRKFDGPKHPLYASQSKTNDIFE